MEFMWIFFQNCGYWNTYIGVDASARVLKPSAGMYPVLYLSISEKQEWAGNLNEEKLKKRPLRVFKLNHASEEVEKQNSVARGC